MSAKEAHFARTSSGLTHVNTLDLRLEQRDVFLAHGLQFHNDQMPGAWRVPESLIDPDSSFSPMHRRPGLLVEVQSDDFFVYKNFAQGVQYNVHRIHSRTEFRDALMTEGAIVVYAGHARFGRGPCFGRGTAHTPGEQWEDGTGADNGIFRMAHPFLAVPHEEVLEHGYTANLVAEDVSISAADCDAELRPHVGRLRALTAEEIAPGFLAHVKVQDPTKKWWTYRGFEGGKRTNFVVLHAGWENTTVAPLDLGSVDIKARVFNHFGCSTLLHNRDVVLELKGHRQADDGAYTSFTTDLSYGFETVYYLYHLLGYPDPARGRALREQLDYVLKKTNADLAAQGARYRIKE